MLISRAPQGARGLKLIAEPLVHNEGIRRAPQGARGLKCVDVGVDGIKATVAPRKGRVG